jgi:hypothetical protein
VTIDEHSAANSAAHSAHERYAEFDAAYVLGALPETERLEFEHHLATCPTCQASVDSLRPVVVALAVASPTSFGAIGSAESPPVDLLPRLLARAQTERRRRRYLVAAVSVVAAACIALVTAVVVQTGSNSSAPAAASRPVAMTALISTPISATAELRGVAWGTKITLHCTYRANGDYPAGASYALVVVDKHGATQNLGTWAVVPGQITNYESGSSFARADIASISIQTPTGLSVLELHP